jgi:hypothetical protein
MGKWFWAQLEEFYSNGFECSALGALYQMSGRLCGKERYRNKVCILSYILFCFISRPC